MADLGAIGKATGNSAFAFAAGANFTGGCRAMTPGAQHRQLGLGTISGTVKENGVAVEGATVMCFHRDSKIQADRTLTLANGSFSFTALESGQAYYCIAFDPASGVVYDDLVYSLIIP